MKISDFYNHEAIIEGYGQARTRKVIQQLREVWPDFLGENNEVIQKGGRSPYFYKEVNNYYAAWLLFILSNCRSHTREDVVNAILRGKQLKGKPRHDMEEMFIIWFGDLLADPERIKRDIRSICIFFNADNMVSVFTEKGGAYAGDNLLFHGNSPAYKIRHSACLEKDFLVEIAELLQPLEDESLTSPGITDSDGVHHNLTMDQYVTKVQAEAKPMDLEEIQELEDSLRRIGTDEATIKKHVDKAKATYEKWAKGQK